MSIQSYYLHVRRQVTGRSLRSKLFVTSYHDTAEDAYAEARRQGAKVKAGSRYHRAVIQTRDGATTKTESF